MLTGTPKLVGRLQGHGVSQAQRDAKVLHDHRGNFPWTGEPVQLLENLP